ncbi:hypothetical protein LINPERHAP2_LOCUS26458 [Linum perenne]
MTPFVTLSLRITLISTAVLSASALLLKPSVPSLSYFSAVVYQFPILWTSFSSTWLTPPYLYLFLNCIIVTIAASSRFGRDPLPSNSDRFGFDEVHVSAARRRPSAELRFEDKFVVSRSAWTDPAKKVMESTENDTRELVSPPPVEKRVVSARSGDRKPVKVSSGGEKMRTRSRTTSRVTKHNRNDTLDDTWKMITEGRPTPLKKHHNKSDTWQNSNPPAMKKSATFKDRTTNFELVSEHQVIASKPINIDGPTMKKSATFKDRTDFQHLRGRKLRKEPSLSQDELNRRVEAFINKFNEEMRMQRQESMNRYEDIIS